MSSARKRAAIERANTERDRALQEAAHHKYLAALSEAKANLMGEAFEDIMGSFWTMMMELEANAIVNDDKVLKHLVEGYFRQWNRYMGEDKKPHWLQEE